MQISEDKILKIRDELPHGAMKTIAKRAKLSRTYVSRVFNCKGEYNEKVLAIAQNILKKRKNEMKVLDDNINEVLS
jgi:hypothetical protein